MSFQSNPKRFLGMAVLAVTLPMGGCFDTGTNNPAYPEKTATVNMRLGLDPVATVLSKSSVISLDRLIIVFTSSAGDTIRDTITSSTTPSLNTVSTAQQTVAKFYNLATVRTWKAVVTVVDSRDSITHRDSSVSNVVLVSDTTVISVNLSSRYVMYQAKFLTIPDSIGSPSSGTVKQKLYLDRFVFRIDGITVQDSTVAPSYFTPGNTYTLYYDYVTPGSHTVELRAYGKLNLADTSSLLYSGSLGVNLAPGADSTIAFPLNWVGPTSGGGSLSVTIGKIGSFTASSTLPTDVVP
jgi:hypothetical protein